MREIREAIRAAFDGDDEIFKYCDPNFKINTIEGLVANIEDKIKDFIGADILFDYLILSS